MGVIKEITIRNTRIQVAKDDITESDVDAIVNAANSYLQHGGGVAGAIVKKGGSIIQEESDKIGYISVGHSTITTGGRLKARYVIHTVGPRWGEGDEEAKLIKAIKNTLELATAKGFKTISLPAISAGIFGFPKELCAGIIVGETSDFIKNNSTSLREITFCLMDEEMIGHFKHALDSLGKNK